MILTLSLPASAQNIRLRGQIDPFTGNTAYSDVYAEGNIAVIGTYSQRGVLIVDITNPDAPVVASHYNPTPTQQYLEAIIVNGIGYFGSGTGDGVHIVNLANPYQPVLLSKVNTTSANGFSTIHEMIVHNGYLYTNSNSFGTKTIKVINVSNPSAPVFVREFANPNSRWIHAMHAVGNKLFTSGFESGGKTDIYDITNIGTQAPVLLGSLSTPGSTHSAWTSSDGNYLYNAVETSNGALQVFNISNPAAPTLVREIKAANLGLNAICPHNPVVMGNLLFVAWYQAGLQVFDITNPADPVRVGQYDTFSNAFVRTEEMDRASSLEPWDMLCGFDNPLRALPTSFDGNWAVYPFLGLDKVILGDLAGGLMIVDVRGVLAAPRNRIADFDGDAKTDVSQFRPSNGNWSINQSSDNNLTTYPFGLSTDKLVPADYDGDGKTDIAVFRPSEGAWYLLQSTAGFRSQQFGVNGDVPVQGDYDSDGKADIAVFRPSNGTWYINRSLQGFTARQWGSASDKPVTGDFDGDGKIDIGVFRPSNGTWYILPSTSSILITRQFGTATDIPLIADFDGDLKTDFSVFRPAQGVWYTVRSSNGAFSAQQFGLNGDVPVPGDYDGDENTDLAVFRPSSATWYILKSADNSFESRQFGESTDRPVPSAYYPQ
ncbi:MAG: VCBS repeat-containing protein [Pyrinomonadaceae bacterium]|nr:VCBS repeat-containing protein [Pyrinomonadaceae bacterium]